MKSWCVGLLGEKYMIGKLQFLLTVKVHFANDCSGYWFSFSPNKEMIVYSSSIIMLIEFDSSLYNKFAKFIMIGLLYQRN